MDLTEQWDLLNKEGNSRMVTGVTIVRTGFLEEHEAAVEQFLRIMQNLRSIHLLSLKRPHSW